MRVGFILIALSAIAADWPQHFGPNRDSHSSETGIANSWPKDGPKVAWRKKAGSGWSGAVVAGDRAILFHRVDNEEVAECIDVATGKEIWKKGYRTRYTDNFNFDDGPRATPLIADGKV